MSIEQGSVDEAISRIIRERSKIIESFIQTWIAAQIPKECEEAMVKSLIARMRLFEKYEKRDGAVVTSYWIELRDE